MRLIQRKFEASLGGMLFKLGEKQSMKKSKLISKTVHLPRTGTVMHYLERNNDCDEAGEERPTVVFFHGLSDQAKNLCLFIASLEIPDNVRILVPDSPGHGENLKRAKTDPNYQQPKPVDILESMLEFLDVLNVKSPCNLLGYSMGGALAYFLKYKSPERVQKTVLISPSLEYSIDKAFIEDFRSGKKRHMCFESRQDVKLLMRDLSTPNRQKQNPIPKFFLEPIFRNQQKTAPKGHYKEMLEVFFEHMGTSFLGANQDIDKNSPRLVIWPDSDFICSYQKGKDFFRDSPATTFETVQDCGHMFHSNGTFILDLVKPLVCQFLLDFSIETDPKISSPAGPRESTESPIPMVPTTSTMSNHTCLTEPAELSIPTVSAVQNAVSRADLTESIEPSVPAVPTAVIKSNSNSPTEQIDPPAHKATNVSTALNIFGLNEISETSAVSTALVAPTLATESNETTESAKTVPTIPKKHILLI